MSEEETKKAISDRDGAKAPQETVEILSPCTEPEQTKEVAPEQTKEEPEQAPKRRGRPAGSKNKPRIIETPITEQTVNCEGRQNKMTEKTEKTEETVIRKPDINTLFTQEEVQQLILNSCRMQEQKQRDDKRERYAALFRKQKWTQG